MLFKNVASQKLAVLAWDTLTDSPKTGDAANITAQISKDWGAAAATNDVNPTEFDSTNHKGIYVFNMTQAETNANIILLTATSTTAGVIIAPLVVFTHPAYYTTLSIDSHGRVDVSKIKGTDAIDQINAECDTALSDYDPPTKAEMDAAITSGASAPSLGD